MHLVSFVIIALKRASLSLNMQRSVKYEIGKHIICQKSNWNYVGETPTIFFWFLGFVCFQEFFSDDSGTVRTERSLSFAHRWWFCYIIVKKKLSVLSVIYQVKDSHRVILHIYMYDAFSHVVSSLLLLPLSLTSILHKCVPDKFPRSKTKQWRAQ